MKILHVTAHLGGGVGKAHAALCASSSPEIERHYVLLEAPRDTRFADQLKDEGAMLTIAPSLPELAVLAARADIVQIEWWNHPRIYEALCRTKFPPMRTVFWCHISGLFAPFVPASLLDAGHSFQFTSTCSLHSPEVMRSSPALRTRIGAVNSGFGFETTPIEPAINRNPRKIAYLGTLDFAKMSPQFFEVVDAVEADDVTVSLWGSYDPDGAVVRAARAMRHPQRVVFEGHAADPQAVLSQTGIFLYLLQPEHYGTAENALVEAMSLGCVPLTFSNPAEMAIVDHGRTGFVAEGVSDAAKCLQRMLDRPDTLAAIGREAMIEVTALRTAAVSAAAFESIYRDVLGQEKKTIAFRERLGETPAQWFLSTQMKDAISADEAALGIAAYPSEGGEAKGSLAHFRSCFPGDPSLT